MNRVLRFSPEMALDLLFYCGFNTFHYAKTELGLPFCWRNEEDFTFLFSDLSKEEYAAANKSYVKFLEIKGIVPSRFSEIKLFLSDASSFRLTEIKSPNQFPPVILEFDISCFEDDGTAIFILTEEKQTLEISSNGVDIHGVKILTKDRLLSNSDIVKNANLLSKKNREFIDKLLIEGLEAVSPAIWKNVSLY